MSRSMATIAAVASGHRRSSSIETAQLTDGAGTVNGNPLAWFTPPLAATSITAAHLFSWSMWLQESDAAANSALALKVALVGGDGAYKSLVVAATVNQGGGEAPTTAGLVTSTPVAPTATTIAEGDRLKITMWRADAAAQGGSGTAGVGWLKAWYGAGSGQGAASVTFQGLTLQESTTPPPAQPFVWGVQNFGTGQQYLQNATETPTQQITRLTTTFGNIGITKCFYSGSLPATWNSGAGEGAHTAAKLVMVCFKGSHTALASGSRDTEVRDYIRSIPAGWRVLLVYWQEPDNDFTDGGLGGTVFTKAEYCAANNHLADVVRSDQANGMLTAGTTVEVYACYQYTGIRYGGWSDDQVPKKVHGISWDTYLNPPPGTKVNPTGETAITGSAYENTSHSAAICAQECKIRAERVTDFWGNTFAGRWGWPEIGAPYRMDDRQAITGRPDGAIRADTYDNLCRELIAAGAWFGILWNSNVGQYDHRLIDNTTTPAPLVYTDGRDWNPASPPTPNREPAINVLRTYFMA